MNSIRSPHALVALLLAVFPACSTGPATNPAPYQAEPEDRPLRSYAPVPEPVGSLPPADVQAEWRAQTVRMAELLDLTLVGFECDAFPCVARMAGTVPHGVEARHILARLGSARRGLDFPKYTDTCEVDFVGRTLTVGLELSETELDSRVEIMKRIRAIEVDTETLLRESSIDWTSPLDIQSP